MSSKNISNVYIRRRDEVAVTIAETRIEVADTIAEVTQVRGVTTVRATFTVSCR